MPAPSGEGFRAVSSDASYRFAISGRRFDCTITYNSRNQSREAGTSSRILTVWKLLPNISHWVLQTVEKGYQYSSGLARPRLWGCESSVRERGHRICISLQQGIVALQPVFHCSKEGWGVASHFRFSCSERLRHAVQVQNVIFETNRTTVQIRGLVCHDRSQGRIFPHIHPSVSQEVPEVRFWGQSIPISGSSVRPSIITLHFHEAPLHLQGIRINELHRRLVDSSSVESVSSSASRCRSCPHEIVGQE